MTIKLSATRLDMGTARVDNAAIKSASQSINALGSVSGATTINLALGSVVTATIAGATTFSVTNIPSSTQYNSFTLILTNGGRYTVTWPAGTIWQNGSAPTLTAVGGSDVLTFFTVDNGTIWRASFAVPNVSASGGQMFVWGQGSYGRSGFPDLANRSSPSQLAGTWAQFSGFNYHAGGIKSDGSLWTFGGFTTTTGSLGLGDTAVRDRSSPTQVPGTWTSFTAGEANFAIRPDGTLWAWGNNAYGGLGLGDAVNRSSPVQLAGTWSKVTVGFSGVRALRTDGTLWAWGDGTNGASGLGDTTHRSSPVQIGTGTWSDVASSGYHGVALKADGSLFVWGQNSSGQLGLGDTIKRSSPVQLDGTWSVIGSNMSAGTHAIRSNGTLWGWGQNNQGDVGDGTTVVRSSPVQVDGGTWSAVFGGQACRIAMKSSGAVFTWAENTHGRLGLGDVVTRSSPTQVAGTWSTIGKSGGRVQAALRL